ncbi:MAG: UDP-glucose 4-epimerase GalE [Micromonosporaceae bacterium]
MKVLITGGAGYIGSTVASACLDDGLTPVLLDDLSTGREELAAGRILYRGDIADGELLDRIFHEHPDLEAVVHCAARAVVPESVTDPLSYWRVNVAGTVALVEGMLRHRCHRMVFSSTAAVYGAASGTDFAVDEASPVAPASPYARTKAATEAMLRDVAAATDLRVLSLRYFNPIGADPRLRTGMPGRAQGRLVNAMIAAAETGEPLVVTGTRWPTRDGTGIRDYVHVWDLAAAHVAALRRFDRVVTADTGGYVVVNLGSGSGTTVREMVAAFEEVTGERLPCRDADPRPGDVAGAYARADRARSLLGWRPRYTIADGIRDALRWERERARRIPGQREARDEPQRPRGRRADG